MRGIKMSNDEFIECANKVHNNKYDYSKTDYHTCRDRVIITCKKHGDFTQVATNHLCGKGCKKCSIEKVSAKKRSVTKTSFVKRANIIHKNKYNYEKVEYKLVKDNIIITCPIHGDFSQSMDNHLQGKGCKKCAKENLGFQRSDWVKRAGDRMGTLYVINCTSSTESFLKIGITLLGVKNRFPRGVLMPYDYTIVFTIQGNPYEIFNKEVILKRNLKQFRYSPKIHFDGAKLECFSMDSLKYINKFLNDNNNTDNKA